MREILSLSSGILNATSYVTYIYSIARGNTRPTRVTWIVRVVMNITVLWMMHMKEALNWQIASSCVGTALVFLLALRYGVPGWRVTDGICLLVCSLGIVLWWTFNDPVLALLAGLASMFFACIPTFRSAWEDPSREDRISWSVSSLSCVCAIVAISQWTVEHVAQPAVFCVNSWTMFYLVWFRKPKASRNELQVLH